MKAKVYKFLLWIVFLSILPAGTAVGAGRQNAAFSADFNDIPISEALSELSRMSRIKIVTSTPVEGKIKKSFRNESIDEIIRELLNGFNYASLWSVRGDGVESITIWVFEKSADRASEPYLPPATVLPFPPADPLPIPEMPIGQRQSDESSSPDTPADTEPKSSEGDGSTPGKEASEAGQPPAASDSASASLEGQKTERAGAVEVQGIVDASQAEWMSLQKGDIILEYEGVQINRAADLVMESRKKTPEEEVEILVLREGVPVRLSARGGFIGVRVKTVEMPPKPE